MSDLMHRVRFRDHKNRNHVTWAPCMPCIDTIQHCQYFRSLNWIWFYSTVFDIWWVKICLYKIMRTTSSETIQVNFYTKHWIGYQVRSSNFPFISQWWCHITMSNIVYNMLVCTKKAHILCNLSIVYKPFTSKVWIDKINNKTIGNLNSNYDVG